MTDTAKTGTTSTGATDTAGTPAVADPPRRVVRGARRAAARSAGGDRWWLGLVGLVLLLAGAGAALLGFGIFGAGRGSRPLLDPLIVDALRAQPLLWRSVAIAAGVALVVFGLLWAVRSLRPERRPDLLIEATADTTLLVTASAAAEAVGTRAAMLPGVGRARARMVGSATDPAMRLTVWITDDADVADVCRRLDTEVVAEARDSLGLVHLPVAVRLERETERPAPRVA